MKSYDCSFIRLLRKQLHFQEKTFYIIINILFDILAQDKIFVLGFAWLYS